MTNTRIADCILHTRTCKGSYLVRYTAAAVLIAVHTLTAHVDANARHSSSSKQSLPPYIHRNTRQEMTYIYMYEDDGYVEMNSYRNYSQYTNLL